MLYHLYRITAAAVLRYRCWCWFRTSRKMKTLAPGSDSGYFSPPSWLYLQWMQRCCSDLVTLSPLRLCLVAVKFFFTMRSNGLCRKLFIWYEAVCACRLREFVLLLWGAAALQLVLLLLWLICTDCILYMVMMWNAYSVLTVNSFDWCFFLKW